MDQFSETSESVFLGVYLDMQIASEVDQELESFLDSWEGDSYLVPMDPEPRKEDVSCYEFFDQVLDENDLSDIDFSEYEAVGLGGYEPLVKKIGAGLDERYETEVFVNQSVCFSDVQRYLF